MKIGWGLIGASTIASEYMINAIRNQNGSEIVAVVSSNSARGEGFAQKHNIPKSFTCVAEMLKDDAISAVYVSTTNDLHYSQVLECAAAGKHIICEKPLALSLSEAKEMVEVCEANGVVLATNHHLRNSATFIELRRLIEAGAIGKVQSVRLSHAVTLPEHLRTWRLSDKPGAGVIMDIAVHDADTLGFLLGEYPKEVTALANIVNKVDEDAMSVWSFPSGILAQVHEGFNTKNVETGIQLIGDEGVLYATNCMTQKPVGRAFIRKPLENGETADEELTIKHHDLYIRSVGAFVNAVSGNGEPAASGVEGVRSLQVAAALKSSLDTGRSVTVQPWRSNLEA